MTAEQGTNPRAEEEEMSSVETLGRWLWECPRPSEDAPLDECCEDLRPTVP